MMPVQLRRLRRDKKAMSPAVSTVIMIAAVMVMILVAMSYASTILNTRLAEDEFGANRQFMVSAGLQIDDVAWTVGRTQTISYSTKFGFVKYQPLAVDYAVNLQSGSTSETFNYTTGMIMYNMPVDQFNLGNNYSERLSPKNSASFVQDGSTALVSQVFVREQLPMTDGSFIRVVAVPTIRNLTSFIVDPSGSTINYQKFFLPILKAANGSPALSQSLTMVGSDVTKIMRSYTNPVTITITASFPNTVNGFNSTFFGFASLVKTQVLPVGSVVEFYIGSVAVSIGRV